MAKSAMAQSLARRGVSVLPQFFLVYAGALPTQCRLLGEQGWRFGNVDTVIVAERPRMTPPIPTIRAELARQLAIDLEQISVKAKTTDGLGFTGREEGIGCYAVALFERS